MPIGVSLEGGPETEMWIQGEVLAKHVENSINIVRQKQASSSVQPINVEHGWKNSMIEILVNAAYEREYWSGLTTASRVSQAADIQASPSVELGLPA